MFKCNRSSVPLVLSAAFAATYLLSACGAQTRPGASASQVKVAPTAAPSTIDQKLFYNFPIKPFAGVNKNDVSRQYTSFANIAKDNGDGKNQWGIWVEQHTADFSSGHWLLNLETGKMERYFIHSDGGKYIDAPSNGGNVIEYLTLMREMSDALQKIGAPQDTLDYVTSVINLVVKQSPGAISDSGFIGEGNKTLEVKYLAHASADILVDVFHVNNYEDAKAGRGVWLTKGRVTVAAGEGAARIVLEKAAPDVEHECFYYKLLPVGGDITQKLASYNFCFLGGEMK